MADDETSTVNSCEGNVSSSHGKKRHRSSKRERKAGSTKSKRRKRSTSRHKRSRSDIDVSKSESDHSTTSSSTDGEDEDALSTSSSEKHSRRKKDRHHKSKKRKRERKSKSNKHKSKKVKKSRKRRGMDGDSSDSNDHDDNVDPKQSMKPMKPMEQGNKVPDKALIDGSDVARQDSRDKVTDPNSNPVPNETRRKIMAPMSREQYEKEQSIIREVYDEESGRWRLVRGSGEIIERIVSREDHQRINQRATNSDGSSFSKNIYNALHGR